MEGWRIVAGGRLRKDELSAAARGSRSFVAISRGSYVAIALGLAAAGLILIEVRKGHPAPFPLQVVCGFALLGVLAPLFFRSLLSKAESTGDMLFDINPNAIRISAGTDTRVVEWDACESFDARADGIWIYARATTPPVFVPKRFLADADFRTLSEFLNLRFKRERAERATTRAHTRILVWVVAIAIALFVYQLVR